MNHRIWTGGDRKEWRELLAIARNDYGDILLTLDGGEVWQFTPQQKDVPTPDPARIDIVGHGVNSKTGELTTLAFLILKDPKKDYTGNLRIVPAPTPAQIGADKPTEILPGCKYRKLELKSCPNGKKPAVFQFLYVPYTVPGGKAWDTVCELIRASAFDGHGVKMKTPSDQFKGRHRAFFSERLAKNESGWYIRTQ